MNNQYGFWLFIVACVLAILSITAYALSRLRSPEGGLVSKEEAKDILDEASRTRRVNPMNLFTPCDRLLGLARAAKKTGHWGFVSLPQSGWQGLHSNRLRVELQEHINAGLVYRIADLSVHGGAVFEYRLTGEGRHFYTNLLNQQTVDVRV